MGRLPANKRMFTSMRPMQKTMAVALGKLTKQSLVSGIFHVAVLLIKYRKTCT